MDDTKTDFDSDSKAESKSESKTTEAESAPATPADSDRLSIARTLASASDKAALKLAEAEAKAVSLESKAKAAALKATSRRDDAKAKADAKQAKAEAKAARRAASWTKAKATAFAFWTRATDDPYNFWTATVYAFATFVAMRSQAETAYLLWVGSKPEAIAIAFVLEGFAIGFAGTRRSLRLKRQTGLLSAVSLVGQWTSVGIAAYINFYAHEGVLTADLPLYGLAMAATSVGAMLLFEIRTSAKIRTQLQNMERLPVPHPVFGLQYALAFRGAYRWAKLAAISSSKELTRGEAIDLGAQMREAKARVDLSNRLASEAARAYRGYRKAAIGKAKSEDGDEAAAFALEAALARLQDVAEFGLKSAAFEATQMSASLVLKAEAEAKAAQAVAEAKAEVEGELARLRLQLDILEDDANAEIGWFKSALADADSKAVALESELAKSKAALESASRVSLNPAPHGPVERRLSPPPPSTPPPPSASASAPKAKAVKTAVAESEWIADFGNNPDLETWAMTNWSSRAQAPNVWALRIAALAEAFPGQIGSRDGVVIPTMTMRDESYGLFWTHRGWTMQAMHDLRALREAGLTAPTIARNPQAQFEA